MSEIVADEDKVLVQGDEIEFSLFNKTWGGVVVFIHDDDTVGVRAKGYGYSGDYVRIGMDQITCIVIRTRC